MVGGGGVGVEGFEDHSEFFEGVCGPLGVGVFEGLYNFFEFLVLHQQ